MSKTKKNRGPNFTPNEKETIIHLISQHIHIVENKKTDAVTTALKNEEWKKIAEEFNSQSSFCVRTIDQLKTCWDNIKRTTRKDKGSTKRETFLTGGRPNQLTTGPLQDQVEAILGSSLNGFKNPYDSDALYSEDSEISEINKPTECFITETAAPSVSEDECLKLVSEAKPIECPIIKSAPISESEDECMSLVSETENNDWNGWSPAALQRKVTNKLETSKKNLSISKSRVQRRRPKSSLQEELLENKLQIVETAKKRLEIESKLKVHILQEQLKQEKIKTEILLLKKNQIASQKL